MATAYLRLARPAATAEHLPAVQAGRKVRKLLERLDAAWAGQSGQFDVWGFDVGGRSPQELASLISAAGLSSTNGPHAGTGRVIMGVGAGPVVRRNHAAARLRAFDAATKTQQLWDRLIKAMGFAGKLDAYQSWPDCWDWQAAPPSLYNRLAADYPELGQLHNAVCQAKIAATEIGDPALYEFWDAKLAVLEDWIIGRTRKLLTFAGGSKSKSEPAPLAPPQPIADDGRPIEMVEVIVRYPLMVQ